MSKVVIISNSSDMHSDMLVEACRRQEVECFRYNTDHFRLDGSVNWEINGDGVFSIGRHSCAISEISLLIYRRPKPIFADRTDVEKWLGWVYDQEWASIEVSLSAYVSCPIVNHPAASYYGQHKTVQLQLAMKHGLDCPQTFIGNSKERLAAFLRDRSCVSKAIYDCSSTFQGKVHTGMTVAVSESDLEGYDPKYCPMQLQERVDVAAMWRIVIVDERAFGFRLQGSKLQSEVDSRLFELELDGEAAPVPEKVEDGLVAVCRDLGLTYCSADFIEDRDGRLWFVDLNPEGQWGAYEKRFGVPISDEIIGLRK